MDLRRGTQLAVDHVVTVLNQISRAVTSKAEVSQVGVCVCVCVCVCVLHCVMEGYAWVCDGWWVSARSCDVCTT